MSHFFVWKCIPQAWAYPRLEIWGHRHTPLVIVARFSLISTSIVAACNLEHFYEYCSKYSPQTPSLADFSLTYAATIQMKTSTCHDDKRRRDGVQYACIWLVKSKPTLPTLFFQNERDSISLILSTYTAFLPAINNAVQESMNTRRQYSSFST